jgi:hypothetical protein
MLLQCRDEADGYGGFALVLARGGDKNARRNGVHEMQNDERRMTNEKQTRRANDASEF